MNSVCSTSLLRDDAADQGRREFLAGRMLNAAFRVGRYYYYQIRIIMIFYPIINSDDQIT